MAALLGSSRVLSWKLCRCRNCRRHRPHRHDEHWHDKRSARARETRLWRREAAPRTER